MVRRTAVAGPDAVWFAVETPDLVVDGSGVTAVQILLREDAWIDAVVMHFAVTVAVF